MEARKHREWGLYMRLARLAKPHRAKITVFVLLSLLATPIALLAPLPLEIVADSVIGSLPLPRFLRVVLPGTAHLSHGAALFIAVSLLLSVALLTQLQAMAVLFLGSSIGETLLLELRGEVFRHIQRLSLRFHDTTGTAQSLYRLQYDAMSVQSIVIDNLVPFFTSACTVLGMLYVTLRIAWPLALVAVLVCPVIFVAGRRYRKGMRESSREARAYENSALAVVQEVLQALRIVKAFVKEEAEQERFIRRSTEGMRARIRLAFMQGQYGVIIGLTSALGTAAVLTIGVRQVEAGVLTFGTLLLLMGYLTQLYEPLKTMGKKSATWQTSMAGVERVFALLDEDREVPEKPNARPLVRAKGAFEFRGASFAYAPDREVLHNVSLSIAPGSRVGIAGQTGAGKTTLISLLLRFYDPTEGTILLDGVDLREYRLGDLRNQFAFVPQEPILFSTSIAENISYARPEAGHEEIVAAAKAAHAHEFVSRLPQGYDTLVGERGMCLSGGERQRISLARAFLKNAPILILDEPTSAVDVGTEGFILEAMKRLMMGRTSFLISHRLSIFNQCDQVLQLANGRLIALDDPESQLARLGDSPGGDAVFSWSKASG